VREISSLLNSEVISIKEGKRLGVISQAVFDLAAGRLLGVIVGKEPAEKGIRASDIKTWGPDVVMVERSEVAKRLSEIPELLAGRRDPGRPPQQVVTDAGQRLGRLGRVYLDGDKLLVLRFEVSGGAWRDLTEGVLSMPVVKGIIHGPDTIIVPAEAVAKATEGASLKASVEKAAEVVREAASESAKTVREAASGTAKQIAESVETSAEVVKKTLATPRGGVEKREAGAGELADSEPVRKPKKPTAPKEEK